MQPIFLGAIVPTADTIVSMASSSSNLTNERKKRA